MLLILSCRVPAQAGSPADSLDLLIAAKRQQLRIPGLQLAVVRHGRIVKLGNYGVANVQESVPVTTQTRFFLNSVTEAFVGVAAMQLVEAGKLDLAPPSDATCPTCPPPGTRSPSGNCSRTPPACPTSCPRTRW